jgi:hypothetical protein
MKKQEKNCETINSQDFVLALSSDLILQTILKGKEEEEKVNKIKKEIAKFITGLINNLKICQKSLIGAIIYFEKITKKINLVEFQDLKSKFCICVVLSLKMWTDRYW